MKMVGVDVGGTFTDAVYYDDQSGELAWAKAPSTPRAPAGGVLAAMDRNGVDLATTDRFVHGVTIGTNAILERRGAPVWVITTKGFRDTLEIARTNRTVLYDIKTLKPASLVPRQRIIEVDERVLADGTVLRALDPDAIRQIASRLRAEPPAALAVCFLHSYLNGSHEEAAVTILRAALPKWFICHSAEILPEMREYERFNTAVLNSYIGPLTARYLSELSRLMRSRGYRGAVHLMASSGGIETAERAARFPVHTVLSGPAGGVAAAIHLGGLVGVRNLITYDMGGTSTDVCLIEDLNVPLTSEQFVDGLPVRTPQIEINSVGAGGGSIAWVDTGHILRVGPRSAGAVPGPACYGKGGVEPTVTDANLAIGRLASSLKLAGTVALDESLAEQAVQRIVAVFDSLDVPRAAEGIIRIAVARMVSAIKEISVSKGYDPRDFALVAFGGAGPMHAVFIAEELEIAHVLVPLRPGNFCAFGALISDVRHDHLRTHRAALIDRELEGLEDAFVQIEAAARSAMTEEGLPAGDVSLQRSAGMRYVGQSWDLIVRLPAHSSDSVALAALFHAAHERRYGYRAADPIEIVSLRVTAIGRVAKPKLSEWSITGALAAAQQGSRQVWFAGNRCNVPVYARDRLPRDARIAGPAIIEEMGAVTIVPPDWRVAVGSVGELHLKRGAQ
ncbi:MAG: hydantoinase/oxoprolinase family protein [Betaproteobacteria bacterium]|nr:hydantoinase/oxoprolinase family protein [Betaproteobacteria bacterium]